MANGHGGKRPGAGRPRLPRAPEQPRYGLDGKATPLDYLLGIMRDESQHPDLRYKAAKDAAPYCHARLQSVQADVDADAVIEFKWDK